MMQGILAIPIDRFIDVVIIIDDRKPFDFPTLSEPVDQGLRRKHPVGVEFNPLRTERC